MVILHCFYLEREIERGVGHRNVLAIVEGFSHTDQKMVDSQKHSASEELWAVLA